MFGGGNRIKLEPDLYEKSTAMAERRGYASLEEMVAHLLEAEIAKEGGGGADRDDAEIKDKLSGLGYIS